MPNKVAKKVASSTMRSRAHDKFNLPDWLEETYPDIYKQFKAMQDLEQATQFDDITDPDYHEKVRKEFMEVYKAWKESRK